MNRIVRCRIAARPFAVLLLVGCCAAVAQESTNATDAAEEINTLSASNEMDTVSAANVARVFPGRVVVGGRFGQEDLVYRLDGLVPLWAPSNSRLFVDVGGSLLESHEQEVNAGLLGRHLFSGAGLILGARLGYDSRWTERDSHYGQLGAGLELMSRWVDMRVQYSYPLTDREFLDQTSLAETSVSRESGRRITTETTTLTRSYEEALEGLDAEAGVWTPFLEDYAPTAVYAGYFHYSSEDGQDFSGMRARIESHVHRQVTLDAGWQEIVENGEDEFYVGVRVRLPLDVWNGVCLGPRNDASVGLAARLDEVPRRMHRVAATRTETKTETAESVSRRSGSGNGDDAAYTVYLDDDGEVVVVRY